MALFTPWEKSRLPAGQETVWAPESADAVANRKISILYASVFQTFFKWGPLSLVRTFYGPPYSWEHQTH